MTLSSRSPKEYLGKPHAIPAEILDLVRERNRRLVTMPPYDRFIANAAGNLPLQALWRDLRRQDEEELERLAYYLKTELRSRAELRERITRTAEVQAAPWLERAVRGNDHEGQPPATSRAPPAMKAD
jgi:hypothetical protein